MTLRSLVVEAMAKASGPWIDVDSAVDPNEYYLARHHNARQAASAALDAALDTLEANDEKLDEFIRNGWVLLSDLVAELRVQTAVGTATVPPSTVMGTATVPPSNLRAEVGE